MKKIIVGRHIEGIALNGLEYLLNEYSGRALKFESVEEAKEYLVKNGVSEEEMYYLKFIEVEEENE